jgi:tetratricopeptide (TPR) repeat protein
MMRLACALALCLALPAGADEKPKKAAAPAGALSLDELLKQADQKLAAGDADGATDLLRKAVALPGVTGEAWLRLGRVLQNSLDLDGAMDAFKAASGKLTGPAQGEALGRLAVVEEMRGQAEASATAEAAIAADPAGAFPMIAVARARARAGQGEEAVALAQKAQAAGGGAPAATALGYAQEARGDMLAAEAAYREAAASDDGRIGGNIGLARVLRKTDRAAEAEPLLKQVLDQAPGAVDAYKESARVKIALRRPDEAMGDASMAAALAENDPEAQRLLLDVSVAKALAEVAANQIDLAIQDLTALRDKNPDFAGARLGLAKAYVAKRQPDAALAELQKAVALEPGLGEAQFELGFVQHVLKGNAAAAVDPYEKAVAAEPGNLGYRTNLGAALSGAGQYERAVAELTKVTQTPGYAKADAWIYLGQAHLQAKKYKDAIPPLEKATAIAPDVDQAWAYLGWCYFGLKDADNFKKAAGKARALGYKEPTLLQYLQRVEGGEAIK